MGAPVFFAHDEAFTLYWVSYVEAVHSRNIRVRPQVGITILGEPPDHIGDGVYFDAVAAELTEAGEVKRAIEARWTRPQEERFMVNSPRMSWVMPPGGCTERSRWRFTNDRTLTR